MSYPEVPFGITGVYDRKQANTLSYTCLSWFTAEVKLTRDYTRRGGEHHTQP
jgi:hypothetical protein